MDIYRFEYRLRSCDVDAKRRFRLSRLFEMLQEAAIAHTELLGAGRSRTLDRGFLWVVTLQNLYISRLPEYDERIVLESWPGETMHTLFPRYWLIRDERGGELLRASSVWTLMDERTRRMAAEDETGIVIGGLVTGNEAPFPRPPRLLKAPEPLGFTVPRSFTDLNGHMNNTRYFDLAEDLLPEDLAGCAPCEIMSEFSGEAREGDCIALTKETDGDTFRLAGECGRRLFRLSIRFKEER